MPGLNIWCASITDRFELVKTCKYRSSGIDAHLVHTNLCLARWNAALEHLALTHPGAKMANAGALVIELLLKVLNKTPLKAAILEEIEKQQNPKDIFALIDAMPMRQQEMRQKGQKF